MSYVCPFCSHACHDDGDILNVRTISHHYDCFRDMSENEKCDSAITIRMSRCPHCGRVAIDIAPSEYNSEMNFHFQYPPKEYEPLPEYIPQAIRDDYYEAIAIVDLSPKASATLARRCLQGMIHDFWGIHKKNLREEIDALQGRVPASQWRAIDATRSIGNIGAHMEKDVSIIVEIAPEEASSLLALIRLLIKQWYIERHENEQLYSQIVATADEKSAQRHS